MQKPILSADSHVLEPPNTYIDRLDKRFKDRAPHVEHDDRHGAVFVVPGINFPLHMALLSGAGKPPDKMDEKAELSELQQGGWDPDKRIEDQKIDGIAAEILYPSIGMIICKHPDYDYRKACLDAYNLWLADYCSKHPDRLLGIGQVSMRTPEDSVAEARKIKSLGLRGVMLPGWPASEDYDSRLYDEFWETCVELGFPVTFHHLPGPKNPNDKSDVLYGNANRGVNSKLNAWMNLIRGNQDLLAMFCFGGVFQRHPKLKLVCAEADAGWVPHFMYRMDYAYDHHRHHIKTEPLDKQPSEYFRNNVYVSFQDDKIALEVRHLMNIRHMMWANDFPHFDSTWPRSQQVIAEQTAGMSEQEKNWILHDNLAECYGLEKPV
ncbi:MAG: amidohydrolase family protein [Candidatus Binataceae bacterium]